MMMDFYVWIDDQHLMFLSAMYINKFSENNRKKTYDKEDIFKFDQYLINFIKKQGINQGYHQKNYFI